MIPPPTAVINAKDKIPVKLNPDSMAIIAPVILNEIRPIESLKGTSKNHF